MQRGLVQIQPNQRCLRLALESWALSATIAQKRRWLHSNAARDRCLRCFQSCCLRAALHADINPCDVGIQDLRRPQCRNARAQLGSKERDELHHGDGTGVTSALFEHSAPSRHAMEERSAATSAAHTTWDHMFRRPPSRKQEALASNNPSQLALANDPTPLIRHACGQHGGIWPINPRRPGQDHFNVPPRARHVIGNDRGSRHACEQGQERTSCRAVALI